MALKAENPTKLNTVLATHGDKKSQVLFLRDAFPVSAEEAPEIVALLAVKKKDQGWRIDALDYLKPLAEFDDELRRVDKLLADMIERADPASFVPGPATNRRRPRTNGRTVRVAALDNLSARRRAGRSSSPPSPKRVAIAFARTQRRGGRRHRAPLIVPADFAQNLIVAGNNVERTAHLHLLLPSLEPLGKAFAEAGMAVLRKKVDRPTLHTNLLQLRDRLAKVRSTEVRLKDLRRVLRPLRK